MNQRWRLVVLWLLPIGIVLLIGWQVISNGGLNSQNAEGTTVAPRNAAVARMSYGRFLDYVEAGRVTAVDIYDGGRNAVIEAVDPEQGRHGHALGQAVQGRGHVRLAFLG